MYTGPLPEFVEHVNEVVAAQNKISLPRFLRICYAASKEIGERGHWEKEKIPYIKKGKCGNLAAAVNKCAWKEVRKKGSEKEADTETSEKIQKKIEGVNKSKNQTKHKCLHNNIIRDELWVTK